MQVASYKKLKVWQEANKLVLLTYKNTAKLPKLEQFGLISQMRRAAISVTANIVEGQSRQTRKEFIQFLHISKGSLVELEYFFELVLNLNYISKKDFDVLSQKRMSVGRLLEGLLRKLKSCNL